MVVGLLRTSSAKRSFYAKVSLACLLMITILFILICVVVITTSYEYYRYNLFTQNDSEFIICIIITLLSILSIGLMHEISDSINGRSDRLKVESTSIYIYYLLFSLICTIVSFILIQTVQSTIDMKLVKLLVNNYANYSKIDESRIFIDQVHTIYSCCGVHSMEDFIDLSSIEGMEGSLPNDLKAIECNQWEYCNVPLTCCRSSSCSSRYLLFQKPINVLDISKTWYHPNGCRESIRHSLFRRFKFDTIVFISLIIIICIHLLSIFFLQLTLTSFATLNCSRLPQEEDSFSWLIGIGYPTPREIVTLLSDENLQKETYADKREMILKLADMTKMNAMKMASREKNKKANKPDEEMKNFNDNKQMMGKKEGVEIKSSDEKLTQKESENNLPFGNKTSDKKKSEDKLGQMEDNKKNNLDVRPFDEQLTQKESHNNIELGKKASEDGQEVGKKKSNGKLFGKKKAENKLNVERKQSNDKVNKKISQNIGKKQSDDKISIEKKKSEDKAAIGKKKSEDKTVIGKKKSEDKVAIGKKKSEDKATIGKKKSEDKTVIGKKKSEDKVAIGIKKLEEKATIEKKKSEDKATIGKKKSEDKATIGKKKSDDKQIRKKASDNKISTSKPNLEAKLSNDKLTKKTSQNKLPVAKKTSADKQGKKKS